MPKVYHSIRSHHAFAAAEPKGSWRLPGSVRPELMGATAQKKQRDRDFRRLDELISAFKNPALTAKRAVDAGVESANGDQQKIEDTNRKLKKELANPLYAASYFAAQRLARNRILKSRRIQPHTNGSEATDA